MTRYQAQLFGNLISRSSLNSLYGDQGDKVTVQFYLCPHFQHVPGLLPFNVAEEIITDCGTGFMRDTLTATGPEPTHRNPNENAKPEPVDPVRVGRTSYVTVLAERSVTVRSLVLYLCITEQWRRIPVRAVCCILNFESKQSPKSMSNDYSELFWCELCSIHEYTQHPRLADLIMNYAAQPGCAKMSLRWRYSTPPLTFLSIVYLCFCADLGRVLGYRTCRVAYPSCAGRRNPACWTGCLR